MDNQEPAEILWHYTDLAGFQQIMMPGAWLYGTHYRFFSDPQEGIYSEDLPHYSTFVTCFTEKEDNNRLWKMWEGKTFCIGFSRKALLKAAQYIFDLEYLMNETNEMNELLSELNDIRFYKVLYSDNPKTDYDNLINEKMKELNIIEDEKKKKLNIIEDKKIEDKRKEDEKKEDILRKNYFLRFKRKKFSTEAEWRIVRNYNDIPQNQVEWIANKPRLPLFPINHTCMIKRIIYKPKDLRNASIYEKIAEIGCQNLGIKIPIAQTKHCSLVPPTTECHSEKLTPPH